MTIVDDLYERIHDEGFLAHLEVVFPRPRVFYLHQALDVSNEARERRKINFYGHVNGWHPALLWHLGDYTKKKQ